MSLDLDSLNAAQRAAVTAADGAHLVIAGAGTGKTRTLVHRVAWLIEQGVDPRDIVLLTFTRRAAAEMLERVAHMVGGQAHGVRGGTFHGFANLALRRHAATLGYTPGFTILDRGDAESLVGVVRSELGLDGRDSRMPQKGTILNVLSKRINTGRDVITILEEDYPQYASEFADIERIGEAYEARKRRSNVMDFDDLLVRLDELLTEHPEVRRRLSTDARHVLVDEYQDTNLLQARIAGLLASVHGNLMVVGDEAQSIYGFRGAVVENILDFPSILPDTTVTVLEENYRSIQPILDLANAVLLTARRGYAKHLRSDLPGEALPGLVDIEDDSQEPAWIVRQILGLREQGVPLSQIAVLFRSGFHSNLLEVELTRANLPFRKFGGQRFVEAAHVKDLMALLRLIANPRDSVAWYRVLPWFAGLGAKGAAKIADQVTATAPYRLNPAAYKGRKYGPGLASLAELIEDVSALTGAPTAAVDQAVAWYRKRLPDLYDDWNKREKDLDTLVQLAERFDTLDAFLMEVTLDPPEAAEVSPLDREEEWLTLSTIHSAKGLEWNTVFLMHLADGSLPSAFALEDPDQIEEERRLFYVAVTRAKRRLYLLRPRFVRRTWGPTPSPGCQLLDDIGDLYDLVDPIDPWQRRVRPEKEDELDRVRRFLAFHTKK